MSFNIADSSQSTYLILSLQASLYENAHQLAQNNPTAMAFAGLPIGIASGILHVATPIAQLAESLLKGTLNIVGSPFFPARCNFSRGLKQLVVETICAVATALFRTMEALFPILDTTIEMFSNPVKFADNSSKKFRCEANKLSTTAKLQEKYDAAIATLQETPGDIKALRDLEGLCSGSRSGLDLTRAFNAFQKSAQVDCALGHYYLGDAYDRGVGVKRNHTLASEHIDKAFAIALTNLASTPKNWEVFFILLLRTSAGRLTREKHETILAAFKNSANSDCALRHLCWGLVHAKGWGVNMDLNTAEFFLKAAIERSGQMDPELIENAEFYLLCVLNRKNRQVCTQERDSIFSKYDNAAEKYSKALKSLWG